uniref:Putative ovule protein n=1 Tax=Solanum chacoense TaxID=4108 RepID=A0A0V0IAI0_SOLCH
MFDDYGRPINVQNQRENQGYESSRKIVKATPKMEEQQDVTAGVLKFRVKLLSEGIGQSDMDVLCQIGLDGIHLLDPATSRTLRKYLLENVTRCEVLDTYIFAFWAKNSVDMEPRRIRLKSNSYTVNNILDTVTAASIQVKEMGESNKPSDSIKGSEQAEKKKGFADLMKLMRPLNEEKDFWVPDEAVRKCTACATDFSAFNRKHHCRNCGDIFCDKCTQGRVALTADEDAHPVRVCDRCMAEVTQRLSNATEATTKVAALQSHEDLTRKLKEVMDKNRKTSTGLSSQGSKGMREVECPTCTVHLQVEVPVSGSETIECSVCQHPFLVSAH